jgi:hypothetical protein
VDAIQIRAAAAHELMAAGSVDGEVALLYVIFPTEEVEAASNTVAASVRGRRIYKGKHRRRALALVDAGHSWTQAAREVGVSKATVGKWIRQQRLGAEADGITCERQHGVE